jgi:hypothetical protein
LRPRTELDNHDGLDDLTEWIHSRAYTGSEGEHDMFTFAWDMDEKGKPVVGDGSDEEPFVIGLTTKALVRRLTLLLALRPAHRRYIQAQHLRVSSDRH